MTNQIIAYYLIIINIVTLVLISGKQGNPYGALGKPRY